MAELRISFVLPPRRERALFVSDYGLRGGRLLVGGAVAAEATTREALFKGVRGAIPGSGEAVRLCASDGPEVRVFVDGVEAPREDQLRAPVSRAAWVHAWLALSGSALGFIASWLYLRRAQSSGDPWSMKMAVHMAAWHLLLTLTLFPSSIWGQRAGIRAVQAASLVFFFIHVGIGVANFTAGEPLRDGLSIAVLNTLSGVAFLATVLYGQRAWASMEPML
jgi:hypothetical protein